MQWKFKKLFLAGCELSAERARSFFSVPNEQAALDSAAVEPIAETKAKIDREIVNKSILHSNAMTQQM